MAKKITIVNMHKDPKDGEKRVRCDRFSPIGNPFFMINETEEERNRVCDLYQSYFDDIMKNNLTDRQIFEKYQVSSEIVKFKEFMRELWRQHKRYDLTLGCWCAPKRCHTETIKEFIESFDKEEKK